MAKKADKLITWIPHLFLFYKEKVFRKLMPIMLIVTIYAVLIGLFFNNPNGYNLGQFHLIFSFILTIIISFRVNSSYARWWEGRILWGSIVNNCRNLAMKFEVYAGLNNNPEFYQLLHTLPVVIEANLRRNSEKLMRELNALGIGDCEDKNPVLIIAQRLYSIINQLRDGSRDRVEQCSLMDQNLGTIIDMVGGCERIANTRVPAAYAFFVKQGLLFYSLMFPFGWVDTFGFMIIPMMVMIVYFLLGLEILSEELEDPFNMGDNCLNLQVITRTIQLNVEQIAKG